MTKQINSLVYPQKIIVVQSARKIQVVGNGPPGPPGQDASYFITPWTDVTFSNSWFNYGEGYQTVQYRQINDNVEIRGLARKNTTVDIEQTIFVLPVGFRPLGLNIWHVWVSITGGQQSKRVDVNTDGTVKTQFSSTNAINWVSFHHTFSIL